MKNLPNILILMCDQLNPKALSCYHGPVPTPNIDRLAREGVLFTDATCPYPACSPSRASLVTGLYPHAHGIVHNCMRNDYLIRYYPETEEGITDKDITTEGILNTAGYETHHYGKWHLLGKALSCYEDMYLEHHRYAADMKEKFERIRKGDSGTWMDWYGWALPVTVSGNHKAAVAALGNCWDKKPFSEFVTKAGRLDLPLEDSYDHRIALRTVDAIKKCRNKPLMLTCSFNHPHDPNLVPSPYYEMFDPENIELPSNSCFLEEQFRDEWGREIVAELGEASLKELLRIYYAQVKMVDDEVGKILNVLEEEGIASNTIVIFTSDHGDMMGGHGMFWKSTAGFYDEVVRIPFIIRYPDEIKPCISKSSVAITDIMPTLLGLTGISVPSPVQGHDTSPYLTGRKSWAKAPEYGFCERPPVSPGSKRIPNSNTSGGYMVRGNGWKYIRYVSEAGELIQEYLYHLEADPGEAINLAYQAEYSATRSELSAKINQWLKETTV